MNYSLCVKRVEVRHESDKIFVKRENVKKDKSRTREETRYLIKFGKKKK